MKVIEKVLTCSSLYDGYNGPEDIERIVADDLNNGWHIESLSQFVAPSERGLKPEVIVTITLRRE